MLVSLISSLAGAEPLHRSPATRRTVCQCWKSHIGHKHGRPVRYRYTTCASASQHHAVHCASTLSVTTRFHNISVCLRPPSSRSPERGTSRAGRSKSGSKTVAPEYGLVRGRECVQTPAWLAHCTDELPLASPRCARVPQRRQSSSGAFEKFKESFIPFEIRCNGCVSDSGL